MQLVDHDAVYSSQSAGVCVRGIFNVYFLLWHSVRQCNVRLL